jgi:hypothetical protein
MSSTRKVKQLPDLNLGASQVESAVQSVTLGPESRLDILVTIDNGAGIAPTDSPIGTFKLFAGDGSDYAHVIDADETLAKVAPAGNTFISRWISFDDVPGSSIKLVYTRTSGGAASRARIKLVTS